VYGLVTPDTVVQVVAPVGLDRRLNPLAALCVLSPAGAVQVTVRALPVPCASNAALGVFGMYGGGGGGGTFGSPRARIVAGCRFGGRGVVGYGGIFDAIPTGVVCMW
jgi:hypothetical protein